MITLICGYKRTGKDTLVKMCNGDEEFKWVVYKNPNSDDIFHIRPTRRLAFAYKLRLEVSILLGIDESIDYDTFKEVIVKDGKTYRDFLIEHAALRRSEDIDYWVRKAVDWDNLSSDDRISVTDWRYPNELDYIRQYEHLNVTTVRVYRSDVPVPSDEDISEHQLDNIITDFLLVTSDDEFEQACILFPQYKNYVRTTVCNKCHV